MIGSTPLAAGRSEVRIWLAREALDMRRSFDALAEQVRTVLAADPLSGHLFVFRSRTGQRVKVLWWDRNGYAIYYKRLERGTFQFPPGEGQSIAIDSGQLRQLLSGCAIEAAR